MLITPAGVPATAATSQPIVRGTVLSRLPVDVRRLDVRTTADAGNVRFTHQSPAGLSHFGGRVTCVVHDENDVRVTGTVIDGSTAAGVVLDTMDFGFTLTTTRTGQQIFSLPKFAPAGMMPPCSDGQTLQVVVSAGHFVIRDS